MDEPSVPGRSARPTDPDVDLQLPAQRRETREGRLSLLAAVALGGALGAAARYAASLVWPTPAAGFPWTTLLVNAVGCAAIGVFMVLVTGGRAGHRLLRPFFGTGVLGGFTTFSTYALDVRNLVDEGRFPAGALCLALTPLTALAAVSAAVWATRGAVGRWAPAGLGSGNGPGGGPEGNRETDGTGGTTGTTGTGGACGRGVVGRDGDRQRGRGGTSGARRERHPAEGTGEER